ncbi:acetate kinase [Lactococcus fujiensis]|uniref:Acetate kinase n=1 Tax=Lactococcus fujiensis JCM 16395 TaxID=1291764 RepID=A0A2A5RKR7_9LACT|nr:acetate kinase [Lactococcus fujiensis]PCR99784.1 acetate kinase [Lactococcus fujiensis JCM 16395]
MSKTLAVNAGSSSLKWQLYEMPEEKVIAKGLIERIGLNDSITTVKYAGEKEERVLDIPNHTEAVRILLDDLKRFNIVKEFTEITGIGHRVVAGGELFKKSTLLSPKVIQQIEDLSPMAPLHNPAHVACMRAFDKVLPDATGVAVFDTAFHATMPEKAFRYPVPNKYYDEFQVRKYGAHGTSHQYVSQEAAKLLNKPLEETKIITCHIGNGASITAVDGGKSVDTSMGFTPLGGIMMGTRSGDLDPSVFPYLMAHDPSLKTSQDVVDMLNKESGLAGISEISSDMRDIRDGRKAGNPKAVLAFEMYCDRIQKYIGQYLAVLNGADAIVFTAGIGENAEYMREAVLDGLTWFGIELDHEKNANHVEGEISTPESRVKVFVIPTDEELMIARDVEALK